MKYQYKIKKLKIKTRNDFLNGKKIICTIRGDKFIISKQTGWYLKNNALSNNNIIIDIDLYCERKKVIYNV